MTELLTIEEWLKHGIKKGWCKKPTCDTHESVMTAYEADAYFDGDDCCIWVTRLNMTDRVSGPQ